MELDKVLALLWDMNRILDYLDTKIHAEFQQKKLKNGKSESYHLHI